MRARLLIALLFISSVTISKAQSISYSLPQGYEQNISKTDYKKIVDLAVAIVSKKYAVESVQDGAIRLKPDEDFSIINLHKLIGKCTAVSNKKQWAGLIGNYFNTMFFLVDEQKQVNLNDFDSIKNHLSIRIYPSATVQQRGGVDNFISRVDLDGTFSVLMLDLRSVFAPVVKQNAVKWHKTNDELFAAAMQNIKGISTDKKTKTFNVGGSELEVSFIENEDYAATYASNLDYTAPELLGAWGAVVAIPNRGIAALCKINKSHPVDFVNFIKALYSTIEKYYAQSAYPVSRQFFWYYQGKFTPLSVTADANGNVNVIAPPALSELITSSK